MERSCLLHQVPGGGCCRQHLRGCGLKRACVCAGLVSRFVPAEPRWAVGQ